MKLYHLAISSNDVIKTQSFYIDYFGFRKGFENGPDGFIVNNDGFVIVIEKAEGKTSLPEWFHFGFNLDSSEQVKELYQRMKNDNIIFSQELEEQNNLAGQKVTIFFCKDPNGFNIEVRA